MITRYNINNITNIYVATRPGEILRLYDKLLQNGYRTRVTDTYNVYGSLTIKNARYVCRQVDYSFKHSFRIDYIDMNLYCAFNDMYTLQVNNFSKKIEVLSSQAAYRKLYRRFNDTLLDTPGEILKKLFEEGNQNGSDI